jgi:catechol 2,3-dioxygenase-like lactoylglutathione lyase family enzyme
MSTALKLDHTSVVVDDLPAAVAFFGALGMSAEGEARIAGAWVDRINAIDGIQVDIVMMRTPDGTGRLELTKFHNPELVALEPGVAPPNALGLRSVMFNVANVEESLAALRTHGATLIGEVVDYQDIYRLCYVRGPAGIIVALAQDLAAPA